MTKYVASIIALLALCLPVVAQAQSNGEWLAASELHTAASHLLTKIKVHNASTGQLLACRKVTRSMGVCAFVTHGESQYGTVTCTGHIRVIAKDDGYMYSTTYGNSCF